MWKNRGGVRFVANATKFISIPGSPVDYWLSEALSEVFVRGISLSTIASPKQGLATGKNDRFVRLWAEVDYNKTCFDATDSIQAMYTGKRWFPYNKGGAFRKWYGNNDCVVNWENNGKEICNNIDKAGKLLSRPQNTNYYFFESITWSKIATGPIAFRYKPNGHIFDVAGCSIFCEHQELLYLLGVVNSKVIMEIIKAVAPTLNYEVGQVAGIPVLETECKDQVRNIALKNIEESKKEWDSFEESWDFKKHPLI